MIYLACDHRGFGLKEAIKKLLGEQGILHEDMGDFSFDADDDYVDFAQIVSQKIAENPCEHKGILTCGTGYGMSIVANKFPAVRAALAYTKEQAIQSREHGDANILILAADDIDESLAKDIVEVWLKTPFSQEVRHKRRLKKIEDIESKNFETRTHFMCDD